MKKIAIYGGSFDPPHKGHKALAFNLAQKCGAEKVVVMPTAMSPFKNKSGASTDDRLNMCRLNFCDDLFEVSDIEICYEAVNSITEKGACESLVDIANKRGGHDNITVVVAAF
jgi:cytidyltransferase-like protein